VQQAVDQAAHGGTDLSASAPTGDKVCEAAPGMGLEEAPCKAARAWQHMLYAAVSTYSVRCAGKTADAPTVAALLPPELRPGHRFQHSADGNDHNLLILLHGLGDGPGELCTHCNRMPLLLWAGSRMSKSRLNASGKIAI
jgi:hypothetical protein